jgi:hypothetical protein
VAAPRLQAQRAELRGRYVTFIVQFATLGVADYASPACRIRST